MVRSTLRNEPAELERGWYARSKGAVRWRPRYGESESGAVECCGRLSEGGATVTQDGNDPGMKPRRIEAGKTVGGGRENEVWCGAVPGGNSNRNNKD
jgi:hypothetical protein